jgi:hypothetical protein
MGFLRVGTIMLLLADKAALGGGIGHQAIEADVRAQSMQTP